MLYVCVVDVHHVNHYVCCILVGNLKLVNNG